MTARAARQVSRPVCAAGHGAGDLVPGDPLKFGAPGSTVPLGLGIGRLIFRVLNAAELTLAVTLTPALLLSDATATSLGGAATTMLIAIWALSLTQVVLLRPRRDPRATRGPSGPGWSRASAQASRSTAGRRHWRVAPGETAGCTMGPDVHLRSCLAAERPTQVAGIARGLEAAQAALLEHARLNSLVHDGDTTRRSAMSRSEGVPGTRPTCADKPTDAIAGDGLAASDRHKPSGAVRHELIPPRGDRFRRSLGGRQHADDSDGAGNGAHDGAADGPEDEAAVRSETSPTDHQEPGTPSLADENGRRVALDHSAARAQMREHRGGAR
jgi:hypothetical protein